MTMGGFERLESKSRIQDVSEKRLIGWKWKMVVASSR